MEDIDQVLQGHDFGRLVGQEEGPELDAKERPYHLSTPQGRFELAKDVSAFANHQGGHLLIGARTERAQNTHQETISDILGVDAAEVDTKAYLGVLDQYVFPRLAGHTVELIEDQGDATALLVVRIPPQDPEKVPFLVLRLFDGGSPISEAYVGFFQRMGTDNQPLDPKKLQRAFRDGLSSVAMHLRRIEEKVDKLTDSLSRGTDAKESLEALQDQRIDQILEEDG